MLNSAETLGTDSTVRLLSLVLTTEQCINLRHGLSCETEAVMLNAAEPLETESNVRLVRRTLNISYIEKRNKYRTMLPQDRIQ